jgi:hypothetical protein
MTWLQAGSGGSVKLTVPFLPMGSAPDSTVLPSWKVTVPAFATRPSLRTTVAEMVVVWP